MVSGCFVDSCAICYTHGKLEGQGTAAGLPCSRSFPCTCGPAI